MVKKNTKSKSKKEKTIHLTVEQAAKFIRGIQECLANANGMEDSEHFLEWVEQTMEECGVPHLKPVPPKGKKLGATLGPFTYVGEKIVIGNDNLELVKRDRYSIWLEKGTPRLRV